MSAAVTRKSGLSVAYRWSVVSRVLAAALGGYTLSTLASIFVARLLPAPRGEAVLTALLLSFALYAAAIIWVFATHSVKRAWLGMLIASAACIALSWMVGSGA